MNDTKIEPWTEADTDRAEQDVDAYGAIMSPEGYRIIAEVKRQAAEIERLKGELAKAKDERDEVVATQALRIEGLEQANREAHQAIAKRNAEIERLTAELAGQSKATLDWREAAKRHMARAEALRGEPAVPHHTISETGGLELNWTFAIHTDGSPTSAGGSIEALFAKWAPLLSPYLNGEQLADLRGDVVRAVDASRPAAPEVDDEPLTRGTRVRTVAHLTALFSPSLHPHRRADATGKIVRRMTSGDIYYDVRHDDGTVAGYERSELIDLTADASRPGLTELREAAIRALRAGEFDAREGATDAYLAYCLRTMAHNLGAGLWIIGGQPGKPSRPGLTEEQALATAGPLSRDIYNRIGLATGNKIGAPEWMRDAIAAALLRASRAAPAPASALPIDHPGVRDALRALAVAMCATQARDPEQKAQLQRGAEAYDALRYALGDKDPAAADAILPVRFPGDVAVPRRVLERLVDATQYEDDVREARDVARRVLHLDALRHEPARTDPEAARRLAEATQIDARLTEPIPDSIGPRGSSYDDAHASKRGATPQLAEARAERDRLDTMFRSYDGGDRPQSPPVSLIRELYAAEERVRELEAK